MDTKTSGFNCGTELITRKIISPSPATARLPHRSPACRQKAGREERPPQMPREEKRERISPITILTSRSLVLRDALPPSSSLVLGSQSLAGEKWWGLCFEETGGIGVERGEAHIRLQRNFSIKTGNFYRTTNLDTCLTKLIRRFTEIVPNERRHLRTLSTFHFQYSWKELNSRRRGGNSKEECVRRKKV